MTAKSEIIHVKDKVLSHEEFQNLQYAVNSLLASKLFKGKPLEFNAKPINVGPKFGCYTDINFSVKDKNLSASLRALLAALGLQERPAPTGRKQKSQPQLVSYDPLIQAQVKSYIKENRKKSSTPIDWAIWYDLQNPEDVSILYISHGVPYSKEGKLSIFQFLPGSDIQIKGRLNITVSSFEELNLANRKNPNQKPLACLKNGDYQIVIGGSVGELNKKMPWFQ